MATAAASKEDRLVAAPSTTPSPSPLELLYRRATHPSSHGRSFDLAAAAAEFYAVACTAAAVVTASSVEKTATNDKQQQCCNNLNNLDSPPVGQHSSQHLSFECEDLEDGCLDSASSEEEEMVMMQAYDEEELDDRTDASTSTDEDDAIEVDAYHSCSKTDTEGEPDGLSTGDSLESLLSSLSGSSSSQESTCHSTSCPATSSTTKTSPWRKVRSLVTSPFIQTYKRQKYPWIQLAGHQGNFLAGQIQGTILKKKSGNEDKCFKAIMEDELRHFVPHFKSLVHTNGETYIELEDLLAKFNNPSIMDIKMGVRTYLEEELIKAGEKPKLRKDMYEKMVAIDPSEPTPEEHAMRAVTKPRYMIWRESISSTSTLGFRIDGVKLRSGTDNSRTNKDFKRTKTEDSVRSAILQFAEDKAECIEKYLAKLKLIRATLESSQFFASHEVIGSSLLFVHDDTHADIWLIDFAKTCPLPAGVKVNHRDAWQLGNHEDGYLTGLDNLIRLFSDLTL